MSKDKIYNSNSICKNKKKFLENSEYIQNQKEIDCITKVLVEHADVPLKLINWLIEAVEKNTVLEYKFLKN